MDNLIQHHCRVCGLYMQTPPWGDDGDSPTYEICPCCNVEFGYEDDTLESVKQYREEWFNKGASWTNIKKKPQNWNREEQLKNIPKEFI